MIISNHSYLRCIFTMPWYWSGSETLILRTTSSLLISVSTAVILRSAKYRSGRRHLCNKYMLHHRINCKPLPL